MGAVHHPIAWQDEFAVSKMSSATQSEIVGGVLSETITLKVQVEMLPALSVAVYVTVVMPTGKMSPGSCELTKLGTLQLSVEVGIIQLTVAPQAPSATAGISDVLQPEITGGVLSITTTSNSQVAILPAPSVAVYLTVVVPKGKISPGECVLEITGTLQLSATLGGAQLAVA